MDAYYINLDSAIKRNKIIQNQILNSNLSFELHRFPAILGSDNSATKPETLSNGQWGCWLSHLEIIHNSLRHDDHLLILEDDEYFDESLNMIVNPTQLTTEKDWDVLYLDATFVETCDYIKLTRKINSTSSGEINVTPLEINSTAYGTHAYIINKSSKYKVFEILRKNSHAGIPIDNVFCAAYQQKLINAAITIPFIASPGEETAKSQIAIESHPLAADWVKFRNLMSIHTIGAIDNTEKNSDVINIINSRNKFSLTGQFIPYNQILKY